MVIIYVYVYSVKRRETCIFDYYSESNLVDVCNSRSGLKRCAGR